jgi:hypothetical protein
MAVLNIAKLTCQILVILLAFLVLVYASPLEKRATQVSLINYTFQNDILAGSADVGAPMIYSQVYLNKYYRSKISHMPKL